MGYEKLCAGYMQGMSEYYQDLHYLFYFLVLQLLSIDQSLDFRMFLQIYLYIK